MNPIRITHTLIPTKPRRVSFVRRYPMFCIGLGFAALLAVYWAVYVLIGAWSLPT